MVKLNPTGSTLAYATFLGGNLRAVSSNCSRRDGQRLCDGLYHTPYFPTTPGPSIHELQLAAGDAFVVKLNPAGSALAYATFLGGMWDSAEDIAVDGAGSAYVTGCTCFQRLPHHARRLRPELQRLLGFDVFVVKLNPTGSGLAYATFLGGSGVDYCCRALPWMGRAAPT